MITRARAFGVAVGLALGLSTGPSLAQPEGATRPGPIIIVYRDDVSNVRQLKGTAHYAGALGRDASVSFTVDNESGEHVCNGTFTSEGRRNGKFSLTCLRGLFSGTGTYEQKPGDRRNSFVARGQTAQGLPIMLVVGRPAGITEGQFLSP
ncbi:MAG: hypothetical protein KIS73_25095 [Enhydrobacter sp.]|nr:hypothetical protein [Enhydrobacter sp.]